MVFAPVDDPTLLLKYVVRLLPFLRLGVVDVEEGHMRDGRDGLFPEGLSQRVAEGVQLSRVVNGDVDGHEVLLSDLDLLERDGNYWLVRRNRSAELIQIGRGWDCHECDVWVEGWEGGRGLRCPGLCLHDLVQLDRNIPTWHQPERRSFMMKLNIQSKNE